MNKWYEQFMKVATFTLLVLALVSLLTGNTKVAFTSLIFASLTVINFKLDRIENRKE